LKSSTSNVLMPLCPSVMSIFDHSSAPHAMIGLSPDQPLLCEINALIWNSAATEIASSRPTANPKWFSEEVTAKLSRYAVL
jgi:hypothetical protein